MNFYDSKKLEAIVETSVDCIIVINNRGIMQSVNKATEKLFGYQRKEMVNENVSMLMPNPHAANHNQYINNYLETGKAKIIGIGREVEAMTKNGQLFPCLLSISEVKMKDEHLFTGIIHDLSEIKAAESQLLKLNTELEQKVQVRTSKLTDVVNQLLKINKDLESEIDKRKNAEKALKKSEKELKELLNKEKELNEMKSKFVTLASHEFRTPLSTILSSANLIKRYSTEENQYKREKHINKISNSVHNLNNILNDFLSLGKLEEGKIFVNFEETCLKTLFQNVLEELEGLKKEHQNIELLINFSKPIQTDKNILRNILYNLISNAIKYSKDDGVIRIKLDKIGGDVKITVKDQGIGIDKAEQQNIFSRFFRANNAVNIKGTGLGLHLVKNYVEKINGKIYFESEINKGSKFFVEIPIN